MLWFQCSGHTRNPWNPSILSNWPSIDKEKLIARQHHFSTRLSKPVSRTSPTSCLRPPIAFGNRFAFRGSEAWPKTRGVFAMRGSTKERSPRSDSWESEGASGRAPGDERKCLRTQVDLSSWNFSLAMACSLWFASNSSQKVCRQEHRPMVSGDFPCHVLESTWILQYYLSPLLVVFAVVPSTRLFVCTSPSFEGCGGEHGPGMDALTVKKRCYHLRRRTCQLALVRPLLPTQADLACQCHMPKQSCFPGSQNRGAAWNVGSSGGEVLICKVLPNAQGSRFAKNQVVGEGPLKGRLPARTASNVLVRASKWFPEVRLLPNCRCFP